MGATFSEPIAAMGINPPSFYTAFGSKEQLFRRALDMYSRQGAPSKMLLPNCGSWRSS
jgi:AcrR family transcriptional regulator